MNINEIMMIIARTKSDKITDKNTNTQLRHDIETLV